MGRVPAAPETSFSVLKGGLSRGFVHLTCSLCERHTFSQRYKNQSKPGEAEVRPPNAPHDGQSQLTFPFVSGQMVSLPVFPPSPALLLKIEILILIRVCRAQQLTLRVLDKRQQTSV